MATIPHQLQIHLDYDPETLELLVIYSYPHSKPHALPEQRIRISADEIPEKLKAELDAFVVTMAARIPKEGTVRLPHAKIRPTIRHRRLTVVIQDKQRTDTPVARMYYLEEIKEIPSQVEREVRIEKPEFLASDQLMASWNRLRTATKRVAWNDYERRFRQYFSS